MGVLSAYTKPDCVDLWLTVLKHSVVVSNPHPVLVREQAKGLEGSVGADRGGRKAKASRKRSSHKILWGFA